MCFNAASATEIIKVPPLQGPKPSKGLFIAFQCFPLCSGQWWLYETKIIIIKKDINKCLTIAAVSLCVLLADEEFQSKKTSQRCTTTGKNLKKTNLRFKCIWLVNLFSFMKTEMSSGVDLFRRQCFRAVNSTEL